MDGLEERRHAFFAERRDLLDVCTRTESLIPLSRRHWSTSSVKSVGLPTTADDIQLIPLFVRCSGGSRIWFPEELQYTLATCFPHLSICCPVRSRLRFESVAYEECLQPAQLARTSTSPDGHLPQTRIRVSQSSSSLPRDTSDRAGSRHQLHQRTYARSSATVTPNWLAGAPLCLGWSAPFISRQAGTRRRA